MSGSDIKLWSDEEDHQQGPVLAVRSLAGDSSYAGGSTSKAELPATALQAPGVPVAVAGATGTSLAPGPGGPLSPTEKESEDGGVGGVSGGEAGLLSAAASMGDDRHREKVRGGGSNQGGDKGGLDSGGGRSRSRANNNIGGAGKPATNQKVSVHAD